jgi:hypothetical protein
VSGDSFYRNRIRSGSRRTITNASCFLEAIADAVQRFDHLEIIVNRLELLA